MENKKEYILEGLSCANCAAKIENDVRKLPEIKEADINLMNSKMNVIAKKTFSEDTTEKIIEIVGDYESSVKVRELSNRNEQGKADEDEAGGDIKPYLFRIIAAVALTALFIIVKVPNFIQLAAFAVAYLLVGYEVLLHAVKNIMKGRLFDENFLMGIASLGAFVIGERTEAIAVLVFYGVGELLQDIAVNKSKRNIAGLMDIRPDYANILIDGNITVVAPEEVNVGDIILVKPGEKIPLDGVVFKGSSFIDTRALTGESVPREVIVDDTVLSGTINTSGLLEITVTKPFGEATVSKILELVQNAGSKKAESEKFVTKFARYYTPIVVFAAVGVAVFPPVFGFGSFADWFYRALSFLIISCPCALVISIPLSFFGGIGGGAKHGVLVKGGNYLDALNQVDTVVFDKTGTLTKGVFEVSKICASDHIDSSELIRYAAAAESHSNHPIAKSISAYVEKQGLLIDFIADEITEIAGQGVIAIKSNETILAGNEKLMISNSIQVTPPEVSGSIIYVAVNKKYMGYILISDEIKLGVAKTMALLKQMGINRTVMLTGDHKNVAKEIADQCQVDEFQAELLPQDKVAWFDTYKKRMMGNGKIVFVGDGINDAPVLAGADIGIAMGGIGSDAAIEAADVVIMNDDIEKIVTTIKIARKTKKIVFQNIIFALGVKAAIMILAFFGITSIWFAIFADVGVAMLALLNAMRAMRIK